MTGRTASRRHAAVSSTPAEFARPAPAGPGLRARRAPGSGIRATRRAQASHDPLNRLPRSVVAH
ncbi:hypothetical protein ORV05_07655 [Amycolatopsis cynarae]|uniref:Uncharacterized protein n=1 Tax=Amycolatopsis cynarae TaxID=2995223 RepID=A0ABY7B5N0_9PSEU|nr:hypothetical protein [Amycolatopsis sp. HUAS 11-8]WAL67646.1 hypothetical protein ORV05_07655 [Amycolatopsis sp. HUAS 11-8]